VLPWLLTFRPHYLGTASGCHGLHYQVLCWSFQVVFLLDRGHTRTQTDKVTDATGHLTHSSATANVGNDVYVAKNGRDIHFNVDGSWMYQDSSAKGHCERLWALELINRNWMRLVIINQSVTRGAFAYKRNILSHQPDYPCDLIILAYTSSTIHVSMLYHNNHGVGIFIVIHHDRYQGAGVAMPRCIVM